MNTNQQPDREKELFEQAVEISSPQERAAFLSLACAGQPALRARLDNLLRAHDEAASKFLGEKPAATPATIRLTMPDEEKLGTMIGRYKLLEKVGEGGFGSVYVAEQREPVKRRVALKVIKLGMDTKEVVARFEAERQALALMDHPNIAKVLDAGATESGRPYFVMELVRGIRITDYCDQNQLPTLDRLKLFIQVCNAVQHAHQKGIIHRDLKPSNILVTLHDGVPVPKVIDFGIAKATQQELTDKTVYTQLQQFIGTPAYISPEQAEMSGLDIDTRADIYSLGVLLYELLAGSTPFDARELLASGLDAMRRTIREKEPVRPSTRLTQQLEVAKVNPLPPAAGLAIPTPQEVSHDSRRRLRLKEQIALLKGDLDWIVMKCLEKDRTRRYDTANGLAADVQRHLSNEPVIARPPSQFYRFRKAYRRNRLAFTAAGCVVSSLVIALAFISMSAKREGLARVHESIQRNRAEQLQTKAEAAQKVAEAEQRRAAAASTAARQSLAAADFYQATRLVDADNASEALPFLARSLSLNPTNPAARTRLFTLLNYRTWLMPRRVLTNSAPIKFAIFSPDGGKILTVFKAGGARIWDATTEQPLSGILNCHTNQIGWDREMPFEFSPDSKRVLTLTSERALQLWDAATGRALSAPFGTVNERCGPAHFSPDGTRVVGVSQLRVQVWDAQNGQPVVGPLGEEDIVSAQYSSDGTKILVKSMKGRGQIFDAQTGQPLAKDSNRKVIGQFVWSPDGSRIVPRSGPPEWDERYRIWHSARRLDSSQMLDSSSRQPVGQMMPHHESGYYWTLNFSPDGSRMITGLDGLIARVWDGTNATLVSSLQHQNLVDNAAYTRDGKRILTSTDRNEIRLWDVKSGEPLTETVELPDSWPPHATPDGQRLLSVMDNGHLWLLDTRESLAPSRHFGEPRNVERARISSDGQFLLTDGTNGLTTRWEVASGMSKELPIAAVFSADGEKLLGGAKWNVAEVWSVQTLQPLQAPMTFSADIESLSFSSDGKWIVTVSTNKTIAVVDARTGKEVWFKTAKEVFLQNTNTIEVRSVQAQFSPDGRWLLVSGFCVSKIFVGGISGAQSGKAYDTQTGALWETQPVFDWDAEEFAFSPDGESFLVLADGLYDTIQIHDTRSGALKARKLEADQDMSAGVFSLDGQQVITRSLRRRNDQNRSIFSTRLRLWESMTGVQIGGPFDDASESGDDNAMTSRLTRDGRWLVTVSTNGQACLWNISPPPGALPRWLPDLLEALSGKVLNAHGVLEPTRRDPAQLLATLRTQSAAAPPTDEWAAWLRWFLADRATRGPYPLTPGGN